MQKILVVDDDPQVLAQIEQLLRAAGYEVIGTSNGRVARHYLYIYDVDLVLTDIYMPEVDGFDMIRTVRERCADTPVVAMSADPAVFGVLPAAVLLGATATLSKPFAGEELLRLIKDALAVRAG